MKPYVLILAGGSGTRLWPLSRKAKPKQLLALYEKDSLMQATLKRALVLTSKKKIFIGTNQALMKSIRRQIPNLKKSNFIIEPEGKNTAPIIALFVAYLKRKGKDMQRPIVVLSADHFIAPTEKWVNSVMQAAQYANERIWCMGIKPTRADISYGYIKSGDSLYQTATLKGIDAFKEKPDQATAETYFNSSEYTWNSGMFIFSAELFLSELFSHAPEIHELALKSFGKKKCLKKFFSKMPNISIDYAILEKSKKLGVVEGDFSWDDLGSFEAVSRIKDADADGNFNPNDANYHSIDSGNNVLYTAELKGVALLGVSGLVIAERKGVLLLAKRDRIGDLKKLREMFPENML